MWTNLKVKCENTTGETEGEKKISFYLIDVVVNLYYLVI